MDFRLGHLGLTLLAHKKKLKPETFSQGEFIVFVNRRQTALKMLTSSNVLIYKQNNHKRINLEMVQYLPTFFNGSDFDIKSAIKQALTTALARKQKT